MQLSNQERMGFGQKPRGERKFTKDADWSELNLFMLLNWMRILMLLDPTQAMMIYQSLVHLPKHFTSMVDLIIWRILTIHCISNKCTHTWNKGRLSEKHNVPGCGLQLKMIWIQTFLCHSLDLLLPIPSPHPTIFVFCWFNIRMVCYFNQQSLKARFCWIDSVWLNYEYCFLVHSFQPTWVST